jgi:hypothetical protein
MSLFLILSFLSLVVVARSDFMYGEKNENASDKTENASNKILSNKILSNTNLTTTTGGPYTYSQSGHHFYGTAYDGTMIDTTGCCSGQSGSCRNNPDCQCKVSIGPLPQGTYTLSNMMTFKGMQYCYELYPSASNNMCGRSGFLIHGGTCSGNPSEGCIVIESESTRYKIKSGATLKVIQ